MADFKHPFCLARQEQHKLPRGDAAALCQGLRVFGLCPISSPWHWLARQDLDQQMLSEGVRPGLHWRGWIEMELLEAGPLAPYLPKRFWALASKAGQGRQGRAGPATQGRASMGCQHGQTCDPPKGWGGEGGPPDAGPSAEAPGPRSPVAGRNARPMAMARWKASSGVGPDRGAVAWICCSLAEAPCGPRSNNRKDGTAAADPCTHGFA